MPVIGRLDDQVDRLLISPVGQRGEPADASSRAQAQGLSIDEERAAEEARNAAGRRAGRRDGQELPVWLL